MVVGLKTYAKCTQGAILTHDEVGCTAGQGGGGGGVGGGGIGRAMQFSALLRFALLVYV